MNHTDENNELLQLQQWQQQGKDVALATVIRTWGSCPRPAGSHLVINQDGSFVGSVSGGCIESAVITEALEVIKLGTQRKLNFDVADDQAWEVGLSCGGKIEIFISLVNQQALTILLNHYQHRRPVAFVTCLKSGLGSLLYADKIDGALALSQPLIDQARSFLGEGRSEMLDTADGEYFLRSYIPHYRLVVIGAVHIAQILAPMASLAGYEVSIIDPRRAFATPERFANIKVINEWPDEALIAMPPDAQSAVVTLSHDPKIDDPALHIALKSPAFYIGCLGSRRTHASRLERLKEAGLSHISGRIHAPVGIKLANRARSPAEIAVSILAEMIATRHGGKITS